MPVATDFPAQVPEKGNDDIHLRQHLTTNASETQSKNNLVKFTFRFVRKISKRFDLYHCCKVV